MYLFFRSELYPVDNSKTIVTFLIKSIENPNLDMQQQQLQEYFTNAGVTLEHFTYSYVDGK